MTVFCQNEKGAAIVLIGFCVRGPADRQADALMHEGQVRGCLLKSGDPYKKIGQRGLLR